MRCIFIAHLIIIIILSVSQHSLYYKVQVYNCRQCTSGAQASGQFIGKEYPSMQLQCARSTKTVSPLCTKSAQIVILNVPRSTQAVPVQCARSTQAVPVLCTRSAQAVPVQCARSTQAVPVQCTRSAQAVPVQCTKCAQAIALVYKECPSSSFCIQGVPKLVHRTCTAWELAGHMCTFPSSFPAWALQVTLL